MLQTMPARNGAKKIDVHTSSLYLLSKQIHDFHTVLKICCYLYLNKTLHIVILIEPLLPQLYF